VLLAVYVEYFSLFIFFCAVLCVGSHTGQKRRKQHESSDAESNKGQSH